MYIVNLILKLHKYPTRQAKKFQVASRQS